MRPVLFLLLAIPLHAGGDRPMNKRVSDVAARLAPTFTFELREQSRHVFETRNLSKGSDTVILVLDDDQPLVWNDDRDPLPSDKHHVSASRVEFTAPRRAPYTLQVRAAPRTLEGTCDIYMDNKLLAKQVSFGAKYKRPPRTPMEMPRPLRPAQIPVLDTYELER